MRKAKTLRQNIKTTEIWGWKTGRKAGNPVVRPLQKFSALQHPRVNGTVSVHPKLMCTSAQTWGLQGHFEGMERTMFPLLWRQPSPQGTEEAPTTFLTIQHQCQAEDLALSLLNTDPSVLMLIPEHGAARALLPLHLCFKGRKWERKFRKSEIPPHKHGWIYCSVLRGGHVGHPNTDICLPPCSGTNSALCHPQVGNLDLAEGVDGSNYPKHQQIHSNGSLTHVAAQMTEE